MPTRTLSLIALAAIIGSMIVASKLDASDKERMHRKYCQEVAVWEAEKARGIDPLDRTGHPDYRGNAAEVCPGMRPAAFIPYSPSPLLVQF
ncbi:hypothetical protein [Vreelandella aquamarina]|uniref:Uncharacterized protein n=1 Tax=Vreelandella aquamarina TaxID=77097 RepID=A0A6F8SU29_9GAMM|nr:hypothetical protein [Halomonas meridiana]BCA91924.1 hypothetical protein HMSLTHF_16990 [Halomonas meridiana]